MAPLHGVFARRGCRAGLNLANRVWANEAVMDYLREGRFEYSTPIPGQKSFKYEVRAGGIDILPLELRPRLECWLPTTPIPSQKSYTYTKCLLSVCSPYRCACTEDLGAGCGPLSLVTWGGRSNAHRTLRAFL